MGYLFFTLTFFYAIAGLAAYSNSNSILLGNQAAGMGGASVALVEDTTALSYYNPAGIALINGREFSATLTLYNKYETEFGESQSLLQESLRLNRGFFQSIPAASSSVVSYGSFSLGLSILVNDYNFFSGEILSTDDQSHYLKLNDESLWFGGNFALNLDGDQALGLSIYYTARSYLLSLTDENFKGGTSVDLRTEEKSLTNNSLVYILGYLLQLNNNWSFGLSYRFPSIEISGKGDFYQSKTESSPFDRNVTRLNDIKSETKIPGLYRLGLAYQKEGTRFTLDMTYSEPLQYFDMESHLGRELIRHNGNWNISTGFEVKLRRWLKWRFGLFSNFSSMKEPQVSLAVRQPPKTHMWGFSSNLGLLSSDKMTWSLGGYYSGGRGQSVHLIGDSWRLLPIDEKIFSLSLGSSYSF